MRIAWVVMLAGAIACSSISCKEAEVCETYSDSLHGLVYVDMYGPTYRTSRPLLCGDGRHFPDGAEMVFKDSETGTEYHAIFPGGVTPPKNNDLATSITLHGRFDAITSTPTGEAITEPERLTKLIPYGYSYFVVSGWELEK